MRSTSITCRRFRPASYKWPCRELRADAGQGHIIDYGVEFEQPEIAAEGKRAQILVSKSHVDLTHIESSGPQRHIGSFRRALLQIWASRVIGADSRVETEMGRNVEARLSCADAEGQRCRQQTIADVRHTAAVGRAGARAANGGDWFGRRSGFATRIDVIDVDVSIDRERPVTGRQFKSPSGRRNRRRCYDHAERQRSRNFAFHFLPPISYARALARWEALSNRRANLVRHRCTVAAR